MENGPSNLNAIVPQRINGNPEMPILISHAVDDVNDMLTHAPTPATIDTASEKSTRSDRSGNRRSLKRKHTSQQNSRKSTKSKKSKEADNFFSGESPVITPGLNTINNGQMACTPASSSSPGDSMSERKLVGSSLDNVYEFTEQEEVQKLPNDTLLKRKRKDYGNPKKRWLLESELKSSINEARRKPYGETQQFDLRYSNSKAAHSSNTPNSTSKPDTALPLEAKADCLTDSIHYSMPDTIEEKRLEIPKLRINRNPAKDGIYECRIIEADMTKESQSAPKTVTKYRTDCGDIFCVGDVVWAKLVGWPWWPAQLEAFYVDSSGRPTGTAQVKWFNWDQISYVKCEKMSHFLATYNSKLVKRRKAGAYKLAVDQALKIALSVKRENKEVSYDTPSADDDDEDDEDYDDEEVDDEEKTIKISSNCQFDGKNATKQSRDQIIAGNLSQGVSLISDAQPSQFPASQLNNVPVSVPSTSTPHYNETAASYLNSNMYRKDVQSLNELSGDHKTHENRESVECGTPLDSTFSARTSSHNNLVSQDFNPVSAHFDLFDHTSTAVGAPFDAFNEHSAARNDDMVNPEPLPDIGPNLSLLNSKSMTCCIPSFSDDEDWDMRPVLDPKCIENV